MPAKKTKTSKSRSKPANKSTHARNNPQFEKLKLRSIAAVAKHPGLRLEELAGKLKLESWTLVPVFRSLLASKDLRKTGNTRGSRYFVKK